MTLTETPDPQEAARGEADEATPDQSGSPQPGVGEAVGGVRAAFMRMLDAHMALLRAELAISGKEIGIIAGLALGAFAIAVLVAILLYVGSFLFLGELLFGSMGWGIIHGTLLGGVIVAFVGINLAGGEVKAYGWGAVIGVIVGVLLAALLLSNVGNGFGEGVRDWLSDVFVTENLPFADDWLVFLSGLVIGGIIGAVVALAAGWRGDQRGRRLMGITGVGLVVGAVVGTIYLPTRYDATDGVLGLAIMMGLLSWIIAGVALAARAGFDPEARYANIFPRESITAFGVTKEFLMEQWERQKNRMMGR